MIFSAVKLIVVTYSTHSNRVFVTARLPRLYAPGCSHHIIQRGNNRNTFFYEKDYDVYLKALQEASGKYAVEVHAFVLMTNHVHLLVTPSDQYGISKMMQSLGRVIRGMRWVKIFNY